MLSESYGYRDLETWQGSAASLRQAGARVMVKKRSYLALAAMEGYEVVLMDDALKMLISL